MREIKVRVYSFTEAAKIKGTTRQTLYNAIERGQITRFEIDGSVGIIDDAKFAAYVPLPSHWDSKRDAKRELANAA